MVRDRSIRFQNGETPGWPTGFVLEHNPSAPKWTPVLTERPAVFGQCFCDAGWLCVHARMDAGDLCKRCRAAHIHRCAADADEKLAWPQDLLEN